MDYEKKYKDALERAKKIIEFYKQPAYAEVYAYAKEDIPSIFPELEESEDEKIRKELISFVRGMLACHDKPNAERDKKYESWIYWLEKPKYTEKDLDKAYKCADEVQYRRGYEDAKKEIEKQGEQKLFDYENANIQQKDFASNGKPKFKVGDIITNKKSKDTVKIVQILHDSYCYSGWDGAATVHSDFSISEQDNWELVEQKPTWSEEDEKMRNKIL